MNNSIKPGSLLIEDGIVYQITKILPESSDSKNESIIYYKPLAPNLSNSTLECSIPKHNLGISKIRQISTSEEIEDFFDLLALKNSKNFPSDQDTAISLIHENKINGLASAIQYFWKKVVRTSDSVTRTDLQWLSKSIDFVSEEVALVSQKSLDKTKNQIKAELSKYYPPNSSFDVDNLRYQ